MKLLSKNEIIVHKAKERQLEIEQGLKLSSKVDELRKTLSEEESSMERFKNESIKSLHAEIGSLMSKKDAISNEVMALEERKKALLIPLDAIKEKLKERERAVTEAEDSIRKLRISLESLEKRAFEKGNELNSLILQEKSKISLANDALSDALEAKRRAEHILKDSEEKSRKVMASIDNRDREVSQREFSVSARESSIRIKTENQDKRERELNAQETSIKDRYQALLRTESRLKK